MAGFGKCGKITAAEWNPDSPSGVIVIASGVTGDIATINAPAGKRVRLVFITTGTTVTQAGISIIRDGVTVIDEKILEETVPNGNGDFYITQSAVSSSSGLQQVQGILSPVTGEQIIIRKNAGNTTESIDYNFEIGD